MARGPTPAVNRPKTHKQWFLASICPGANIAARAAVAPRNVLKTAFDRGAIRDPLPLLQVQRSNNLLLLEYPRERRSIHLNLKYFSRSQMESSDCGQNTSADRYFGISYNARLKIAGPLRYQPRMEAPTSSRQSTTLFSSRPAGTRSSGALSRAPIRSAAASPFAGQIRYIYRQCTIWTRSIWMPTQRIGLITTPLMFSKNRFHQDR